MTVKVYPRLFLNPCLCAVFPLPRKASDTPPVDPTAKEEIKPSTPPEKNKIFPSFLEARKARYTTPEELKNLSENGPCFQVQTEFGLIDFIRAGNPKGPTILLIPGIPGQSFDYHKVVPLLAQKGFDVLVVSPPGKGFSTCSEKFTPEKTDDKPQDAYAQSVFWLDTYADFWQTFLTEMALENVTAVGFSAGFGEISHAISKRGKKNLLITRLVSISGWAPLFLDEKIPDGTDRLFTAPEGAGELAFSVGLMTGQFRKGVKEFFHKLNGKPELEPLVDQYMKGIPALPEWGKTNPAIGWYCKIATMQYGINDAIEKYSKDPHLNRQDFQEIPLFAIVGENDTIVRSINPEETTAVPYAKRVFANYTKKMPAKYSALCKISIYPDSGHLISYEDAEKLAQDIGRFASLPLPADD
jgi:pimeloyl-ACP methyl ester carboxylesterase